MKNKFVHTAIKLSLFAATTMAGWSCKKFIEVEPVSQYSIPQVFSDVTNATTAVVGVYDELMGDNGYGIRVSLYYPYDSDEMIVTGNIDGGRRDIGRYRLQLSNSELTNPFNALYRGVEKANLCIEQIPQMALYNSGSATEQKELRRLYGEVLTLRAQFYFELIRNWGDVPAPMIPAYKQTDLFIPRSDRDSTYDKLLNDLLAAEDLVPWRTEVPRNERVTKGAVKALRAKMALFRGGYSLRGRKGAPGVMERRADYLKYYQIAKQECADLMANRTQHTLNTNYESIWKTYLASMTYDPSYEILFEAGAGGANSNSDSRMGQYSGPSVNASSRYGSGGGGVQALPNLFYAFDSADKRRDVAITYYQVNANNNKGARRLGELTDGKYRRDWRNPIQPAGLNLGFNWGFIRFADVLLMFAEADNEISNGPTAAAKAAYEEVRLRAFGGNSALIGVTPSDKTGFFNAIVDERLREFAGEGVRKFDLIRWNLLGTKIAEARTKIQAIQTNTGYPDTVWVKNNGEELQYYAGTNTATTALPFWRPTNRPNPTTGWTAVLWRRHLTNTTNAIDNLPLYQGFASFFTPGKSELFPFSQATLDAYQGKLEQNPGY
jgi:hypothetical protein